MVVVVVVTMTMTMTMTVTITVIKSLRKWSIVLVILLPPSLCFAGNFDKEDRALFTSICILQVLDGLTTISHLGKNPDNHIMDTWSWKYGTGRPSPELLWGVKALELVGTYYVGRALPSKWRKGFFIVVDSLLLFYVHHNLEVGASFAITF